MPPSNEIYFNGINNPGAFCYIIASINSLYDLLKHFIDNHKVLIEQYIEIISINKINIYLKPELFKLEIEKLFNEKNNEILENINKVNNNYKLKLIDISYLNIIKDKLINNQLEIGIYLLISEILIKLRDTNLTVLNINNLLKLLNFYLKKRGLEYICDGSQNDACEFMYVLIDILSNAVNISNKKIKLSDKKILSITDEELNKMTLNDRVNIQYKKFIYHKYNKFYNYFDLNLNNTLLDLSICSECKFINTNISDEAIIHCFVLKDMKNINDVLNYYFNNNELQEPRLCNNCKKNAQCKLLHRIIKNKKYLIINLKRFNYNSVFNNYTKNSNKIDIYFNLDCDNISLDENKKTKYELISVICHIGIMGGGHYYTYLKLNDNWLKCNDEIITNVNDTDDILNDHNSYILFYRLINN